MGVTRSSLVVFGHGERIFKVKFNVKTTEFDGRTELGFPIKSKLVSPGADIAVVCFLVLTTKLGQHAHEFGNGKKTISFSARLCCLLQAVAGDDTSVQIISVVEAQVVVILKGGEPKRANTHCEYVSRGFLKA